MEELGFICGRFQPFHNGHLKYAIEAKKRCKTLIIGLTQPDIENLSESTKKNERAEPFNNPLTYDERCEIITASLLENGFVFDSFEFKRFPLDTPEVLGEFIPKTVTVYTNKLEKWNSDKENILSNAGYKVEVLWEDYNSNKISGTDIRNDLLNDESCWKNDVSSSTVELLNKLNLKERLLELKPS